MNPKTRAPRRSNARLAVMASTATLAGLSSVRAEEKLPPAAATLPEVTVQQAPAKVTKRPPAEKSASRPKPSVAKQSTPSAPPERPHASGNPGAPSTSVAAVPGATGAGPQTATAIDLDPFNQTSVFSVSDVLRDSPGVSLKQGNGPRDLGISIRGSNARNGFGIRNIVILEDGFPVTQPDGLSRSDLIDPHAYSGIDVWRGPSSALFGNYASGGALNFRTWPGRTIDGVTNGIDAGSFGYLNNYVIAGTKGDGYEGSVFTSDVRGDGYFEYGSFDTQTINALLSYQAGANDRITLKAINNRLETELPFRTSLNQFRTNPFQDGCQTAATSAPGCATNAFSATGSGAKVTQTAEQASAGRNDRRTLGGFRWEHAFDADTASIVQLVVDDRNINQPTGTTSAIGDYLSYNLIAGIQNRGSVFGLQTAQYIGAFWNYLPVDGQTYNVAPGGDARLGLLQSRTLGSTMNFGAKARQDIKVTDEIAVVSGVTVERTLLDGAQRSFTYSAAGATLTDLTVNADRSITNVAPELGVLYTPDSALQLRARVGTGYGAPQFTNLFVTPSGQPGSNTDLQSQTNVGIDIGADWTPARGIVLSLTGFYEFFRNELVSQSPGPGLPSFTFNAPASEHRGIEAAADLTIAEGLRWKAAYIHNDQIYTEYSERLSGSTTLFDRSGNRIPGVSPNELTTRLSYDAIDGFWRGVGAYVEYQWHDGFYMENANLLKAPAYDTVDVNLHYDSAKPDSQTPSFMTYVEVRNIFDTTYVASANNITDTVGATPASLANISGSIYAGAPRTYYGGMKVRF